MNLGVFYLQQKHYEKQSEMNEIAENQYYLALCFNALQMEDEHQAHINEAKRLYLLENRMSDIYINLVNKIYLKDIENELKTTN